MSVIIENKIRDFLKENKITKTKEIEDRFQLTQSTTRRYLIALEEQKLIKRKFGEIIYIEDNVLDVIAKEAIHKNIEEKKLIAKNAANFAKDHQLIYLDAGSTCYYLLDYLKKETIIYTNSLINAEKAINLGFQVNIIGGKIKKKTRSIVEVDHNWLQKIKFPIAFMGVNGISANERLTTPDILEGIFKNSICNQSNLIIVLCEAKKIGVETFYDFTPEDLKKIKVITSKDLKAKQLAFVNAKRKEDHGSKIF
ncbi:MAG: DeoR/GlpR family DNA-binding transcription regulator [Mycoplasmoidaceae bacterium]